MSELEITLKKIKDIRPYPGNPRKNDAAVSRVADSLREFGWRSPVVVDEAGVILAGHTRLKAAEALGMREVPVHVAVGLSEAQARAFRLADNRTAQESTWDEELLTLELAELKDMGYDLALTAFDPEEIEAKLSSGTEGLTDEDEIPEPPDEPITKAGDVWELGRHRLVCGDATKADDVQRLLGDVKPHLMVTDPPYGVNYDAKWRQRAGLQDAGAYGKVTNDQNADWTEAWALFPGDVAYVWHAGVHSPTVADSLSHCGFEARALIVWAKDRLVIGRGHYHHMHEPCWYAVKKGGTGHWAGDRKQTTLWKIDKPRKSETGHSTQKPVECMRRPIVNNSSPGQAVYDPFLGSGTTMIAAESEGRHCFGLEIDPSYCDIIVDRWQNFTGEKAKRVEHGGT